MATKKLYHVSCAYNHESIMTNGLVPFRYMSYEETPGPIYLATKKPTSVIERMQPVREKINPILDDYMQMSAYKHDECPMFNLYEIDKASLNPEFLKKTDDRREITYSAVIPPHLITFVKSYDTKRIEEQYQRNQHGWF
jgi:hypothetical protein